MITDPWFYLAAAPAMLAAGLSKSGFLAGIGVLCVPFMALVISPVQAVGILLPVLVATDVYAVIRYWRHKEPVNFRILVVAGAIGTLLGWATAALVSEDLIRLLVGIVGFVFGIDYFVKLRPQGTAPGPSWPRGLFWGGLSAYTSFLCQAGGPMLVIYLLAQRLPSLTYAATACSYIAVSNVFKVVPYYLLGQLSRENVLTALALLPMAFAAVWLGSFLLRRVPEKPFYAISYGLLIVICAKLMWDGSRALAAGAGGF